MAYDIIMNDGSELPAEQIINQTLNTQTFVVICEGIDDCFTKAKQFEKNIGTDLLIKSDGTVVSAINGYCVDGLQIVPNGDGSYTSYTYVSGLPYQDNIYNQNPENT